MVTDKNSELYTTDYINVHQLRNEHAYKVKQIVKRTVTKNTQNRL